ncbi:MAG: LPS export ABC transporter permease LptG [Deltaproteobacteria bacterium]|nr:MAG: LPS export ABC transporter permease LptG [Deltaproteobacteria bacterium]
MTTAALPSRPRILEAYVSREFLKLCGLLLATFISIFLVVDFFEKIDRLVRAQLGVGDLLEYFLLKVPLALTEVLPPTVLLGVMLTFGLMSRNHETMAIRAAGLDILRLARPAVVIALIAAVLLLSLKLYLVPWSQGRLTLFWETKVQKKPPPSLLSMQHFWYKGDQVIYNILLFRKDTQTLEGVKIYLFDRQFNLVQITAAARAQWQGDHWRFYEGFVQTFGPGDEEFGEQFQERDIALTERPEDFAGLEKKVTEMDLPELHRFVQRLERDGYKSTPYRLDIYRRVSLSITPLILVVLGMALTLRGGMINLPAMVTLGLGLMFGYWLLFGLCTSFGEAGRWPLLLAVTLPHLGFGAVAFVLARQVAR